MNNFIYSKSLFPLEKGDFDSEHFKSQVCAEPHFFDWLRLSFTNAYNHLNAIDCTMSKRLRSSNLHEFVFNELTETVQNFVEIYPKVSFTTSYAGNEKNFFTFGDYIFMLKKEDVTPNKTKVSDGICHQEAQAHIITIEYVISPFHDAIVSLNLVYYKNNAANCIVNIPLSPSVNVSEDSTEAPEIVPTKPKLSRKNLGENAVG